MGTFKVTDLMIKVLPQGPGCFFGPSAGCGPCTEGPSACHPSCGDNVSCACSCTNGCTGTCTGGCSGVSCGACSHHACTCSTGCSSPTCGCSGCSGGCTCSHSCGPQSHLPLARVAQAPEDRLAGLSALKEQLKQQLAEVEQQHSAAEEGLRPQTIAQVDELQKKLESALEELKARRTELEQRKPPSA